MPVGGDNTHAIATNLAEQFLGRSDGGISLVVGLEVYPRSKPTNRFPNLIKEGHRVGKSVGKSTNGCSTPAVDLYG